MKTVPCPECCRKFVTERHLRRHYADAHKQRRCAVCGAVCENKYALSVHRQKVRSTCFFDQNLPVCRMIVVVSNIVARLKRF